MLVVERVVAMARWNIVVVVWKLSVFENRLSNLDIRILTSESMVEKAREKYSSGQIPKLDIYAPSSHQSHMTLHPKPYMCFSTLDLT